MSLRIVHYSDPHFGACDMQIADAAVTVAVSLKPDVMVVSGDFSMRARRRELSLASAWLKRLPQPQIIFPGNHDVPGLNHPFDRFFAPFRRYRKYLSEIEEPELSLPGGGLMVTANSSTPFGRHLDWSLGFLSPLQAHRIEARFETSAAEGLRVLGIHHPLLASGVKKRATVSPLPLVAGMLQKSRVDLVLAGHFHQSTTGTFPDDELRTFTGSKVLEEEPWRVVVSQAPSICSTRLKGEPNGFHVVEVDDATIEITLWRWQSGKFVAMPEVKCFQRNDDGWHAAARID